MNKSSTTLLLAFALSMPISSTVRAESGLGTSIAPQGTVAASQLGATALPGEHDVDREHANDNDGTALLVREARRRHFREIRSDMFGAVGSSLSIHQ